MKAMVEHLYQKRQGRPKCLQNLGTGILNLWIPPFPYPAIYQLSSSVVYISGSGQDTEIPGPDRRLSDPRCLPKVQPSLRPGLGGWTAASAQQGHDPHTPAQDLHSVQHLPPLPFPTGRIVDPNVSGRSTSHIWCLGCLHGRVKTIAPSEML